MTRYKRETTERIIENAVGQLGRGFYRLQADGLHKEAYDTMGVILDMLLEDREQLRTKLKGLDNG